jgi:hypothetical protein
VEPPGFNQDFCLAQIEEEANKNVNERSGDDLEDVLELQKSLGWGRTTSIINILWLTEVANISACIGLGLLPAN